MEVTQITSASSRSSTRVAPARQTVVIVGNGMTSWRMCRELVASRAIAHLRVIVVGDEPVPAYDRVRLTALLGGTRFEELILADEEWYARAGIELRLGEAVAAIDRQECLVRTAAGRELLYDRLVLATGAAPFVPPIPGLQQSGVFVYRTVADVQAIRGHAQTSRRAVVIGGGLLGIEAARAAHDLGLEVQVLESAPRLMPRQLDERGAALLAREIERLGVRVHVGRAPIAIEAEGDDRIVHCTDGGRLRGDLIIVSAGVRPASALARAAGLRLAPNGGILVDDLLTTSDERIFAIGDCASHDGTSCGLVGPGYEMVRVIVANLIGQQATFGRHAPASRLKLMGIEVASVGDPVATGADARVIHDADGHYRKLLLTRGRLVGALAVGSWPGFDRVAAAVGDGIRPSRAELRRFRRHGELWPTSDEVAVHELTAEALVCACAHVTRAEIETACRAGACDTAEVCRATTAGTMCGACRPVVDALVAIAPQAMAAPQQVGAMRRSARSMTRPPTTMPEATPRPLRRGAQRGKVVTFRPPLIAAAQVGRRLAFGSSDSVAGEAHGELAARGEGRRQTMAPFHVVPGVLPYGLLAAREPVAAETAPLLLALALTALALLVLAMVAPAIPALAGLLDTPRPRLLRLVTGYTTLGFAAGAVLLSLRKRLLRKSLGSLAAWRVVHASFAIFSIASLAVHTGVELGENLNRALLVCYLATLVAGVAVGVAYASQRAQGVRRWALRLHIIALLPIPALLTLHLIAAYFYG